MAQKLIQTQEQKLQQVQRLSAQQMLQVHLLEMPLTELEENINAELDDNPALEASSPHDALAADHCDMGDSQGADEAHVEYDNEREREDRESALNEALEGKIGRASCRERV